MDVNIFSVLASKGNQAILPAGNTPDALAIGQIGVFDINTGLSVDGTMSPKEIYIAVGTDFSNTGVLEDIRKSAGKSITISKIEDVTYRPHTPARPLIFVMSDISTTCNKEYLLRLEFRNMEIYNTQGYNQFTHTYSFKTECCDECGDCPKSDPNKLVKKIIEQVNNDIHGFVFAEAIDPNTAAPIADLNAFIATNEAANLDNNSSNDVVASIQFTSVPTKVTNYCNINLKYRYPRQTLVIPSLVEGFCKAKITILQEPVMEEGFGYDIKQRENLYLGWTGNPGIYRTWEVTGTTKENFNNLVERNVNYDQFVIEYLVNTRVGSQQEFVDEMATEIAIPSADTTTLAGLAAVFDGIFGLETLADDVAAADPIETNIEKTEDKTVQTDGLI